MIPFNDPMSSKPKDWKRITFAENQPQYQDLPAVVGPNGEVVTEWILDPVELIKLKSGGRIRLTLLTYGDPLQPIRLEVT